MGEIVRWPVELAGKRRRPLAPDEPRGVILFFSGVRYERMAEPAGTRHSPDKPLRPGSQRRA